MNEANRRAALQLLANTLAKEFVDQGLLIEAGWAAFQVYVMEAKSPPLQVADMRMAFFAGAQHLWGSVMSVLSDDEEPTPEDEQRMALIDAELRSFAEKLVATLPTKGTG